MVHTSHYSYKINFYFCYKDFIFYELNPFQPSVDFHIEISRDLLSKSNYLFLYEMQQWVEMGN